MKSSRMPKKRYDAILFEEPLIEISLQPTEEVDPLLVDPTDESFADADDEFSLNAFCLFSTPTTEKKNNSVTVDGVQIKQELDDGTIKIKQEPGELVEQEEEMNAADILAEALNKVEFLCPKCTYRSTDKEEVTHHFVSSHRVFQVGIPRPCDKCSFTAKTVRELAAHKKQSHPRTIRDNIPSLPTGEFKCPHCAFTSFHRTNVRSHTKVHTQDTMYTCDKCPYTAISKLNIENHAACHLQKSRRKWKFKCKHCGLLERTEKLLQRHLILHGEGEMLRCQLCDYKSPYSHIISMHTRICHGIVGKRRWQQEERWRKIRQSTRKCAREKKSYAEDKDEELSEEQDLSFKRRRRRTNKQIYGIKDTDEKNAETEDKENSKDGETENSEKDKDNDSEIRGDGEAKKGKTEEQGSSKDEEETPQTVTPVKTRPTLQERLGRAHEVISRKFTRSPVKEKYSKPDKKVSANEDKKVSEDSSSSDESDSDSDNSSDEENSSKGNSDDDNSSKVNSDCEKGSKVHSNDGNSSKVNTDDEKSPKVNSDSENRSKVNSDDEDGSKVNSDDEDGSKVNSDSENRSKVNSDDEDGSKVNSDDENGSKVNSDDKNGCKGNSNDENSSKGNLDGESDWKEESSEEEETSEDFDAGTAEESSQSCYSDKPMDAANKEIIDGPTTEFDKNPTKESSGAESETEHESGSKQFKVNNDKTPKRRISARSNSDCELEHSETDAKKLKLSTDCETSNDKSTIENCEPQQPDNSGTLSQVNTNSSLRNLVSAENDTIGNEMDEEEPSDPPVLVLKRNGASFTCFPKNNSDSS